MRKMIYLFFAFILFVSCMQNEPVRYASSSPEIDVAKTVLKLYVEQDWQEFMKHYADTAKILNNVTKGNEVTVAAVIGEYKQDHELFSSIQFVSEEDFFEMVVTDDNEIWVNYWGVWVGILNANNQKYEIPVHVTMRFMDRKIVIEHGYWNNASVILDLYKLDALSAAN
jgi:hypothetical protein